MARGQAAFVVSTAERSCAGAEAFRSISASRPGALHVPRKPFGIEADGAGDGEDAIEVEGVSAHSSAQ